MVTKPRCYINNSTVAVGQVYALSACGSTASKHLLAHPESTFTISRQSGSVLTHIEMQACGCDTGHVSSARVVAVSHATAESPEFDDVETIDFADL